VQETFEKHPTRVLSHLRHGTSLLEPAGFSSQASEGQVTAVASKSVQSSLEKKNWLVARLEEVVLPQVGITALVVREIGQIPLTPRDILQVHLPDSRTRRHLYLAVRID
jgi:hypothetical protein